MQQTQLSLFVIIILTLLVSGCRQVSSDETLPTTETVAAGTEMVTLPSPTPTATNTATPLPTLADIPTSTPTNTPIPPPTPTAIPADAPSPTTTRTSTPSPAVASPPDEVDLVTLEESLAVLDRVDRRAGPTSTPIRPMIFKGAVSYVDWTDVCTRRDIFDGMIFTAVVLIDADGNVSGTLSANGKIEFTGTRDSISGERIYDPKCPPAYCTKTLQARLTNNDQTFEGTIDETCTGGRCVILSCLDLGRSREQCGWDKCGGLWTFSLPRK